MYLVVGILKIFSEVTLSPLCLSFKHRSAIQNQKAPKPQHIQHTIACSSRVIFFLVRWMFHKWLKQKSQLCYCFCFSFWKSSLTLFHFVCKIGTVTAFLLHILWMSIRYKIFTFPCLIISLLYYYVVLLSSSEHQRIICMSDLTCSLPRKQFCVFEPVM